jgi:DNA-binding NarL/FixJ family response regulator
MVGIMNTSPASVLVIEKNPLMREALYAAIVGEPDLMVAAQAVSCADVVDMVVTIKDDVVLLAFKPDIILLTLGNPSLQELQTLMILHRSLPLTPILALTMEEFEIQGKVALEAGASAVLRKSAPREELICALRKLRPGA